MSAILPSSGHDVSANSPSVIRVVTTKHKSRILLRDDMLPLWFGMCQTRMKTFSRNIQLKAKSHDDLPSGAGSVCPLSFAAVLPACCSLLLRVSDSRSMSSAIGLRHLSR